jgi:FkbM family methyltransferase
MNADIVAETAFMRGRKFRARDIDAVKEVITYDTYGIRELKGWFYPLRIVDAGAHIGTFSFYANRAWPKARIDAIEMIPGNVTLLRETALLCGDRCNVIPEAIGYNKVNPRLIIGKEHIATGGNSIREEFPGEVVRRNAGNMYDDTPFSGVLTPLSKLVINEGDAPSLLKLDVEGMEGDIFKNDGEYVNSFDVVFGEFHTMLLNAREVLSSVFHDYDLHMTGHGDQIYTEQDRLGRFWAFPKTFAKYKFKKDKYLIGAT